MVGTYKSAAEMLDLYMDLINKYPYIIALIDPFRKEVSGAHLLCVTTQTARAEASSLTFPIL